MSHGPVDVFAAKSGRVLLIQVKSGSSRINQAELELLKSYALAFNADAEVWSFKKRGKIQKVTISKRVLPNRNRIPKGIVPKPLEAVPIQSVETLNLPS
jgi:Holliday junction resolvase